MHHAAPPIQAPTPEFIAKLLEAVESDALRSGPLFCYDQTRGVFMSVIVDSGVIVHWQIEPARDKAAATALQERYMQAAAHLARAALRPGHGAPTIRAARAHDDDARTEQPQD